jgi:hypothetical protein
VISELPYLEDRVYLCLLDEHLDSRKTQPGNAIPKYCSNHCRHNKPGSVDRKIEDTFAALLEGGEAGTVNSDVATKNSPHKPSRKMARGDPRILVACGTVEELVFGPRHDPEKVFGRKKNRATRALTTDDGESGGA